MTRHPWQSDGPALILASASYARRALLAAAGLAFESIAAEIDEETVRTASEANGASHAEIALDLADRKAIAVSRLHPRALVIGADQILSAHGVMWSKPTDLAHARRQLGALRGSVHVLHTAVVLAEDGEVGWRHLASPEITARRSSDALLDLYVEAEGDSLLQTVGACRAEGAGQILLEHVVGEHAAILGLPLLALLAELRRRGILMA